MLVTQPHTTRQLISAEPPPVVAAGTNGANGRAAVDAKALLAPVQPGLRQVEAKMKVVDSELFAPLATAFVDLIGRGGKRLRPALALMAAQFNGDARDAATYSRVLSLAASVEMLHTATLVHDDVIDDALLRRGAPTLNANWSKGATVIAGNYMFGQAAQFSAETENMRVIRLFSDTLDIIVNGELHQLSARDEFEQKKESYYQRIYAKTASLFCAATEGAAVLTELPESQIEQLRNFGYNFGMAFQIVDDVLDFTGDETTLGKPAGGDLRQGTLTLPFFYYLQSLDDPQRVIDDLRRKIELRDQGDEIGWHATVQTTVADVRSGPAIQQALAEANLFLDRAQHNLVGLTDNVYKESMAGLCDFVVRRTH